MAARVSRGARLLVSGAAAACVVLVAVACGVSSDAGDEQRGAPTQPKPVVHGLVAYVGEANGRTAVVTGGLDGSTWRVHPVPGDPAPNRVSLQASANGRVVVVSVHARPFGNMTSLHVMDVRSGSLRQRALPSGAFPGVSVSPDGTTLALQNGVGRSLVSTAGGTWKRVAAPIGSWSPDGRSWLYVSTQLDPDDPRPATTSVEFGVRKLDRPRLIVLATMAGEYSSAAAWSPDSRRVAIVGDARIHRITIVSARGSDLGSIGSVFPLDLVWTWRGIYTFGRDRDAAVKTLVLVDPDTRARRAIALHRRERLDLGLTLILAPPSGDVVGLLNLILAPPSGDVPASVTGARLRVFSPNGRQLLDRTLRGTPDSPANGGFTVVLVDP